MITCDGHTWLHGSSKENWLFWWKSDWLLLCRLVPEAVRWSGLLCASVHCHILLTTACIGGQAFLYSVIHTSYSYVESQLHNSYEMWCIIVTLHCTTSSLTLDEAVARRSLDSLCRFTKLQHSFSIGLPAITNICSPFSLETRIGKAACHEYWAT